MYLCLFLLLRRRWQIARTICTQQIYGLYGLKPHIYIVEIDGDVTNVGETYYVCTDKKGKIELLSLCWTATFITIRRNFVHFFCLYDP